MSIHADESKHISLSHNEIERLCPVAKALSSPLRVKMIGLLASRASLLELGEAPAWIATSFIVLGILMALMGYVVGTPLAVVCAHIMESLA